MKFNVIAYETTSLTYEIEADTPEQALEKYNQSEHPDEDFGEPDEELLGVDDVRVERQYFAGGVRPADVNDYPGDLTAEG